VVSFGCADNTLRAIDAVTGKQVLYQMTHNDWVLDTAFSTNGEFVVSVGRDQTAKLNELKTQRFVDNITSITPGALKGGIHSVVRHPDRDEVLVGSSDGTPQIFRLFRLADRKIGDNSNLIRKFPPMPGRIFGVDYRADGKRIVAGSSLDGKGYVNVYESDFDSTLSKDLIKILEKVADSRSSDEQKAVEDYLTRDVKLVAGTSMDSGAFSVAFMPDGRRVIAASGDGVIRVLDADTATLIRAFLPVPMPEGRGGDVIALTVEPGAIELSRMFDYNQIVVKGWLASGESLDVTHEANYTSLGCWPRSSRSSLPTASPARWSCGSEFRSQHCGFLVGSITSPSIWTT
jgi:WD40 repeat protein